MHVLLTAIGSYGDVHPYVGLGKTLAARGHDVSIVCNPYFASMIERAGLQHLHIGTVDDYQRLTTTPNVWNLIEGPKIVLREAMADLARPLYEIVSNAVDGDTVIAAHPLDLGSRIFHEQTGTPFASVELAPLVMRSVDEPPKMPFIPQRAPRWMWRSFYYLADRLIIDRILSGPINQLRRECGLTESVKRFYDRWWYSPQLILCMWPDWFGPPQPDWPPNCHTVGFPLWDETDQASLSDCVEDFLNDGDAPIVFTPGSANSFGEGFFAAAVQACQLVQRRGILLTKFKHQVPSDLPDAVQHFSFEPLSHLLHRAAAFVHHGGIGSTSQALAAGVPQLIMPMAFDQPDNAQRVYQLGVAESLVPKRFRGPAVAAALERLIGDLAISKHYKDLAKKCDGRAALTRAAELLEQLHAQQPVAAQCA